MKSPDGPNPLRDAVVLVATIYGIGVVCAVVVVVVFLLILGLAG